MYIDRYVKYSTLRRFGPLVRVGGGITGNAERSALCVDMIYVLYIVHVLCLYVE